MATTNTKACDLAATFRPLVAKWKENHARYAEAEANYLADPDDAFDGKPAGPLCKAYRKTQDELVSIESLIQAIAAKYVGYAPAALQVDGTIITVGTRYNNPEYSMVAIVDLGRVLTIS